jgi:hypothetical protein
VSSLAHSGSYMGIITIIKFSAFDSYLNTFVAITFLEGISSFVFLYISVWHCVHTLPRATGLPVAVAAWPCVVVSLPPWSLRCR